MKAPFLFICSFFFIFGCTTGKKTARFEGIAMTVPYIVQIGDPLDRNSEVLVEEAIFSQFHEIHETFNNWNPHSEVSSLNRACSGQKVRLSNVLAIFFEKVNAMVLKTEGKFDPTMSRFSPPDAMGWNKVHFQNGLFWKDHDETRLDFCGAVKGYTVDLLAEKLKAMGFKSIYVEWGGEIKTFGRHPEKRPWKIAIHGIEETLTLKDMAIATSGNYLQNWLENGKSFTHIVDPKTKRPLEITSNSINSVSVLADSCFEADALATALMLFEAKEQAEKWAKEHGFKIWIY